MLVWTIKDERLKVVYVGLNIKYTHAAERKTTNGNSGTKESSNVDFRSNSRKEFSCKSNKNGP